MESPLYTFPADLSATNSTLWIALFTAAATLAGAILLLRRPAPAGQRIMRQLGAMLLFFAFLIAAGTAAFSFWTQIKLTPVRIYADAIETPYGRAEFADIVDAGIRDEVNRSLVDPSLARGQYKLLVIEERSGRMHALPEKSYDIRRIMDRLREAVKEWRGKADG